MNFHPIRVYNEVAEKHIVGSAACDFGISCPVCWRDIYVQKLNRMQQSDTSLSAAMAVIQDFGYSCYKIPVLLFIWLTDLTYFHFIDLCFSFLVQ